MFDFDFDRHSDMQDILHCLNELIMSGWYAFRGYSEKDEMLPGVIRKGDSYKNVENLWLDEFEKYGSHYFQANSPIDFLSYAQHFGLPTRLLDFTTNPYIALFFALHSKKEGEDAYYYLRYADLNENIVLNTIPHREPLAFSRLRTGLLARETRLAIKDIESVMTENDASTDNWIKHVVDYQVTQLSEEYLKELITKNAIVFIDPSMANPRIIMQQGIFMLPYTLDKTEHLSIVEKNSKTIRIHSSHRDNLIEYLNRLGFNAFRLMPDLASVCTAIRNSIEY